MPPAPLRRRSRIGVALVAAAASAVVCGAVGPASSQATEVEQISRADGVAGASPIESHGVGGLITDDGKTAFMTFSQTWGTWTTATGIWKRDLVTDRSTQILGGFGYINRLVDREGKLIAISTRQRLASADTNNADDLYLYDTTTRRFELITRLDGPNGAAAGSLNVISPTVLTRSAKQVLFTTADGVQRRDLTTGRTVKVADGTLGTYGEESASADGTVFSTQAGLLVSPRRTESITIPDAPGARALVSPDGRQALVSARHDRTGVLTGFRIDIVTGQRTPLDLSALGRDTRLLGLADDGRLRIVRSASATGSEVVDIVPTTGVAARIALYGAPIDAVRAVSSDGRFATLREDGPTFAASADGVSLPGGTDLPSPGIYVKVFEGCLASGFPYYSGAQAAVLRPGAIGVSYLPKLSLLGLRLMDPSGAVIKQTIVPGAGGGTWPTLPLGGPFRLTATAKYADGRTTAETWTILAPALACAQGF